MTDRFQFSTLMKTIIANKVGTFSQEDLLLSIFNSIFESMGETGYKVPEQSTISRWITGERPVPAKVVERCKAYDAKELIEKDIRTSVLKHITNVEELIYGVISLVRRDNGFRGEHREELINYEPKLEKDHSGYLALAVISAVKCKYRKTDKASPMSRKDTTDSIPPVGRSVPVARPFFTGREKEIRELEEALLQKQIVFLYGQRGIGKSALAAELASCTQLFSTKVWLTYAGSLRQTIEAFSLVGQVNNDAADHFEQNMRWFKSQNRDTLVILDNFDVLEEQDDLLFEFLNCGCSILVTSHMHHENVTEYALSEMEMEDLRTLFTYYYEKNKLSAEELDEIITAAHRHTMVVVMIAKLMQNSVVDASTVIKELHKSVDRLGLTIDVALCKDGKTKNTVVSAHLSALFDLSTLNEEQVRLLVLMAYIPIEGVNTSFFCEWSGDVYANMVSSLVRMGWIERNYTWDVVAMHPLVAEHFHALREEHEKEILVFLQTVVSFFKGNYRIYDENLIKISVAIAQCHSDFSSEEWLSVQFENACNIQDCGHKISALNYMQHIVESTDFAGMSSYFATFAYYRIGCLNSEMVHYEQALQNFEKALSFDAGSHIVEPQYCMLLINCLLECALLFAIQKNSTVSQRFMTFLMMLTELLPKEQCEEIKSRALYKQGEIHRLNQDHQRSLQAFKDSYEKRIELYGDQSQEAGLALAQIGLTYKKMEDYQNAAEELHKAYEILEQHFPATHPNLVSVQLSLGIALETITGEDLGVKQLLDYLADAKPLDDLDQYTTEILTKVISLKQKSELDTDSSNKLGIAMESLINLISKFTKQQIVLMRKEYGWKKYRENPNIDYRNFPVGSIAGSARGWDISAKTKLMDYHKKQALTHEICHYINDNRRMPPPIPLPNRPIGQASIFFAPFTTVIRGGNTTWFKALSTPMHPIPDVPKIKTE